MRITASGEKTVTQSVGTVWEIGFKVSPAPEPTDDQHNPVRVYVDRPDGTACTVVATVVDGVHVGHHALDVEGEYVATVVVDQPEGGMSHQGGYSATATPIPEDNPEGSDPAPASDTQDDSTDQPASGPDTAQRPSA